MIPDRTVPLVPFDERTGLISKAWYDWLSTMEASNETRIAALESRATALEAGPNAVNWTPVDTSGAGLTLTVNNATYSKYGKMVTASCYVVYPGTANANISSIGGFPFAVANGASYTSFAIFTSAPGGGCVVQFVGSSFNIATAGPATFITNAQLSGQFVICGFSFPTTT